MFYLYEKNQRENNFSKVDNQESDSDKILMKSLYLGCIEGYKNYGFDTELNRKLSKKCANYLFIRRTSSKLPQDSLFRYSSKLADDICL